MKNAIQDINSNKPTVATKLEINSVLRDFTLLITQTMAKQKAPIMKGKYTLLFIYYITTSEQTFSEAPG